MPAFTPGPWAARCRDVAYEGGDWPDGHFLQWEVEGPRVPDGRGEFYRADALLVAAAPAMYHAALRVVSAQRAYPEDLPAAIDALSRVLCEADPQLATDAKD